MNRKHLMLAKHIGIGALITLCLFRQMDGYTQAISLSEVLTAAEKNYPGSGSYLLHQRIYELESARIQADLRPQVQAFGQASWQSDVTKLDIEIPSALPIASSKLNTPTLPQDIYKAGLDFTQRIYHGGAARQQRNILSIEQQLQQTETGLDITSLKNRVTDLYFNVLLLTQSREISLSYKQDLEALLHQVSSGVRHGALLQANEMSLQVEIMTLDQHLLELEQAMLAARASLSELTGLNILQETHFLLPEINLDTAQAGRRGEQERFELITHRLDANSKLLGAAASPSIMGYSQLGIGRPALNMFSEEFEPYAIIGLRLNWSIWDWHKRNNQQKILGVQKDIVSNQYNSFNQGVKVQLMTAQASIRQYEGALLKDQEIIKLREGISQVYSARLQNGEITSATYIQEKNAEVRARLQQAAHKISLEKAKANYLFASGKWK